VFIDDSDYYYDDNADPDYLQPQLTDDNSQEVSQEQVSQQLMDVCGMSVQYESKRVINCYLSLPLSCFNGLTSFCILKLARNWTCEVMHLELN